MSNMDYSKLVEPAQRKNIVEQVLRDQAKEYLSSQSKLNHILKFIKFGQVTDYLKDFPKFDSITKLEVFNNNELYEFIHEIAPNIKFTAYKSSNFIKDNVLFFVFDLSNNKRLVCLGDSKSWKSSLSYWNSDKYPYSKWTDISIDENLFTREVSNIKMNIVNGKVKFWEKLYNFPNFMLPYIDQNHNTKIGAIDLETYGSEGEAGGLGIHKVYAAGIALQTGYYQDYFIDHNTGLNNADDIINKLFLDLFDYINMNKKERNGFTLYAHNLGRFDSIFILKSLVKSGLVIKAHWQNNDILFIKITDTKRKLSVKLKDSIKLIPTSLDKMLKTFNCEINKGIFPHTFVSEDSLNYVGPKPDIKYYYDETNFNESQVKGYNNLPDIFNLKQECLAYLKSDVMGLLEAMGKISLHYFDNYRFNITKFNTLPSLAVAIFGRSYIDSDHTIKVIKGPMEHFIRQAYFGGNSNIFVDNKNRIIPDGYHYDMNSQFPTAMKSPMPTGNPVFSNNTDLNYYTLGFVFAKITPPCSEVLPNLFLQSRHEDGSVSCPREEFYEYISTVDLRQGLEYGYKAEILCGVNFPDACESNELFGPFVDKFYEIKNTAKDSVSRNIAKLILNSTYGKFGQREHEYSIRLLDKASTEEIVQKYHYNYLTQISEDLFIIRTGPKLNDKLRQLYIDQSNNPLLMDMDKIKPKLSKDRGIMSAVQISAMISAYARVSINPYKNIPDNLAIASNTDSLILRKPLDDNLIGKGLGQWKLEHKFKDGIFIKPKLYCYRDYESNELIRKASGINACKLSYNDYIELAKGNTISTEKTVFNVNWKNLILEVINMKTKVTGIKIEEKTLNN